MILASILTNPRERSRFFRFAFVGIVGAVVDFGVFNLLTNLLGFSVVVASVFSFIAAILSNFTWNRYWTYPESRSKTISHQLVQFTLVSVLGLLIRTPIIAVLERPLRHLFEGFALIPIGFIDATFVGNNLALATGVAVVMFWNFFINRYWTYNDID
jgi:putative flippase GtrA